MHLKIFIDPLLYMSSLLECQFDLEVHLRTFKRYSDYHWVEEVIQKASPFAQKYSNHYGSFDLLEMLNFYSFIFQIPGENEGEEDLLKAIKDKTYQEKKDRFLIDLINEMWFNMAEDSYFIEKEKIKKFIHLLKEKIDIGSLLQRLKEASGLEPDLNGFDNMYLIITSFLSPHTFLLGLNDNEDLAMGLDYRRGPVVINPIIHELTHFFIGPMLQDPVFEKWMEKIINYKDFLSTHERWKNIYPETKDWLEEQVVKAFADYYVYLNYGQEYAGFTGETRLSKEFQKFLFANYTDQSKLKDFFINFLEKTLG